MKIVEMNKEQLINAIVPMSDGVWNKETLEMFNIDQLQSIAKGLQSSYKLSVAERHIESRMDYLENEIEQHENMINRSEVVYNQLLASKKEVEKFAEAID
jgi:hypothetical protein